MHTKISPCLWFDHEAEDAARFYTAIFKDSKIVSTACSALVRLMFVAATTAFTRSSLITRSSRTSEAC